MGLKEVATKVYPRIANAIWHCKLSGEDEWNDEWFIIEPCTSEFPYNTLSAVVRQQKNRKKDVYFFNEDGQIFRFK